MKKLALPLLVLLSLSDSNYLLSCLKFSPNKKLPGTGSSTREYPPPAFVSPP